MYPPLRIFLVHFDSVCRSITRYEFQATAGRVCLAMGFCAEAREVFPGEIGLTAAAKVAYTYVCTGFEVSSIYDNWPYPLAFNRLRIMNEGDGFATH
jgi:hypothetical protein